MFLMAIPQDLLLSLARAYVLTLDRGTGDPELLDALEEVREAHGAVGWLVVRVEPDGLHAAGDVVPDAYRDTGRLRTALMEAGIGEVRFQEVMEPEVLEDFLRRLHPSGGPERRLSSARFRGLEGEVGLFFRKAQAIPPGMAGSIQRLFEFEELRAPGSPDAPESAPEVSAPLEDPLYLSSSLPPELEEDVWAFLEDRSPARSERANRIREGAASLQQSRDLASVANVVQFLVEAAGDSPKHRDTIQLARDLTTPAVASYLVARLGSQLSEGERERLIRVTSHLGREAALALADALGEARDRFQRRSFMDALVAAGPMALEMAEAMVKDPRWFVVRNGVSILGEIGGEQAVTHLTSTLANADPRVRRETVLALAKLGGPDAVQLILGMLDDPEADVRAATCRALGALKEGRALKPLLAILELDQDEEVQVECLRALGQLGDPGAVPLIEKRAVPGLFSRSTRELRVAAYRALAGIGTPHAKGLLEKAAVDADMGVRTVVQALLAQG
jgi:hypothetical protein